MTIGGWVFFGFIVLFAIAFSIWFGLGANSLKAGLVTGAIGFLISIISLMVLLWYFNSTASGARAVKTQLSNFNNGINRKVTVYDATGNILQTYEGKFDVEYDDDRILFDDEKGLRHVIYYPTGTVIIDETEN